MRTISATVAVVSVGAGIRSTTCGGVACSTSGPTSSGYVVNSTTTLVGGILICDVFTSGLDSDSV